MPHHDGSKDKIRKRVSNACRRCRRHKIKCSGSEPCVGCDQKGLHCEFGIEDKKVAVSESTLQDLRSRLNQLEQQQRQPQQYEMPSIDLNANDATSQPMPHRESLNVESYNFIRNNSGARAEAIDVSLQDASPMHQGSLSTGNIGPVDPGLSRDGTVQTEESGVDNPLVPEQPAFMTDDAGNLRYLGLTSTWSFSRQVLRMTYESPQSRPSTQGVCHIEGEAYNIEPEAPEITASDLAGLPAIDISLYHLQTVKFRTQPMFYLFDEADFTAHLHRFNESPVSYAQKFRSWFVHYLVLMAFAKAFAAPGPRTEDNESSELFTLALRLLPEVSYLCGDPVGSTELLCCIALYHQAVDHRSAAHIYIGQAMRMALSFGLHTELQANVLGEELVKRGRRIWWTVYSLDRKVSCLMGCPNSLHDNDITTPLPNADNSDTNSTAQTIHVKICRLLGDVVSTVYSRDGTLNKTYLATTQIVLRGVAGLASELRQFSERCFGQISRVAAHLNLAYHHCILLASRPFLFYILKYRLQGAIPGRTFPVSSSAKGLVQVCIDSAAQLVSNLSKLRRHELLDAFMPFDLECAFSAAFVLVMASSVHPTLLPQNNWLSDVNDVFDYVSMKGNVLGSIRKSEVEELVQMLNGIGQRDNSDPARMAPVGGGPSTVALVPTDPASVPSLGDPFFDEWVADNGLSDAQIMGLADVLQPGGLDDFLLNV